MNASDRNNNLFMRGKILVWKIKVKNKKLSEVSIPDEL
jgi:hypothetical protein